MCYIRWRSFRSWFQTDTNLFHSGNKLRFLFEIRDRMFDAVQSNLLEMHMELSCFNAMTRCTSNQTNEFSRIIFPKRFLGTTKYIFLSVIFTKQNFEASLQIHSIDKEICVVCVALRSATSTTTSDSRSASHYHHQSNCDQDSCINNLIIVI